MEHIAIPIFGTRVSPRFAFAPHLLLATAAAKQLQEHKTLETEDWSARDRIRYLSANGVNLVICGGINRMAYDQLVLNGITVFAWVTGEAREVLEHYLSGTLQPRETRGACRGSGRRGRCHGNGGPGRGGSGGWRGKGCDPADRAQ